MILPSGLVKLHFTELHICLYFSNDFAPGFPGISLSGSKLINPSCHSFKLSGLSNNSTTILIWDIDIYTTLKFHIGWSFSSINIIKRLSG